jgi:dihydroorotate dehydrogenase (NAD+) catalytic subunit
MSITLAGVELEGPIVAAAGAAGCGPEILSTVPPGTFGAITTKSITPEPREGHPPWRVLELPTGMINAVGLANPGLDVFMSEVVPTLRGARYIGSIAGHTLEDYVQVASAFESVTALPLVEANMSCPNTGTGRQFSDDAALMREAVAAIKASLSSTRLLVKLPLETTPGLPITTAAIEGGADGITLMNTIPAMVIDVKSRRPRLSNTTGGLSGPAIHQVAVGMVARARRQFGSALSIVGVGGVLQWKDAAEFILAGADAVGMATGLFVDPRLAVKVGRGLARWCQTQNVSSIRALVGQLQDDPIVPS